MPLTSPTIESLRALKKLCQIKGPELKVSLKLLLAQALPEGLLSAELLSHLTEYLFDRDQQGREYVILKEIKDLKISHANLLTLIERSSFMSSSTERAGEAIARATTSSPNLFKAKESTPASPSLQPHQSAPCDQLDFKRQTLTVGPQSHTLIPCPPDEFLMGTSRGEGELDESPQHRVILPHAFLISESLITESLWHEVMKSSAPRLSSDHPIAITNISWWSAVLFCNRLSIERGLEPAYLLNSHSRQNSIKWLKNSLGYRLPTEAEWEYAAKLANSVDSLKEQSPHSQIWSSDTWCWCYDHMSLGVYRERTDGVVDPCLINQLGDERVIRGGRSPYKPHYRLTARSSETPHTRRSDISLRIVQTT
jgi:formylglycine-generating enzyme required for sulfatase activity